MNFGTRGYKIGDRIESAPHTDCWMMGDRYGDVVKIGRTYVHVKMDRSGKVRQFHPDNLLFTRYGITREDIGND